MNCEAVTGITNALSLKETMTMNNDGAEVGNATALTVPRMLII